MTAHLPPGFLWGAASSAHQTEGNNTNSNWWHLETMPGSPLPERSDQACDSYHRYREDMTLLAGAGLDTYRFSVEWARIEPRPGQFDQTELAHYRDMITTAVELGLTPVVTTHHFTNPQWFAQSGGWEQPGSDRIFARYAEQVARILHDVPWIVTINEPNMIALSVGLTAASQAESAESTDERAISAFARKEPCPQVGTILADAHGAAVEVLRARTDAQLGWTVASGAFEALPGGEDAMLAAKHAWEDRFFEVSRCDDFVGVQAYTTRQVGPDGTATYQNDDAPTLTGWPFRPDAVGIALRNAWDVTGGIPLLVTENGVATDDDNRRIAYLEGALAAVDAAVADGVDVRGYLHWSALDNYEWGDWTPTFGLIAVDRRTFARCPRPSLAWLGRTAAAHRATTPAVRELAS